MGSFWARTSLSKKYALTCNDDKYWFIKAETTRSIPAPLCARMSGKEWARDRLANIAKIPLIIAKKNPGWNLLVFTLYRVKASRRFDNPG